jgi:predicted transcriptional regulator
VIWAKNEHYAKLYFANLYDIVDLIDLHKKKIDDILDEKQVFDLPLIEQEADIEKVFSVLTGRDHVWVVKERGSKILVGLITESDVLHLLAPPRLPKYTFGLRHGISLLHGTVKTASDIMHKQLLTCSPEDSVEEVLSRMVNSHLRRLPVIDKEEIVGEITIHYIIQVLLDKRKC